MILPQAITPAAPPSTATPEERADIVLGALELALEVIAGTGIEPHVFARILAASDDPGSALMEHRETADALASWLLPAVRYMDIEYVRWLPPAERDDLPSAFIAATNRSGE